MLKEQPGNSRFINEFTKLTWISVKSSEEIFPFPNIAKMATTFEVTQDDTMAVRISDD